MSMLTNLNFILNQTSPLLKKQDLLQQILPLLSNEIIHGKLSKIWITNDNNNNNNNNNKNNFISIYDNEYIQININDDMGKTLLTKIIYFIIKRIEQQEQYMFFIVLNTETINLRKILWNHNKKLLKNNSELFKFMMRSFLIVNQRQYENCFQN